MTSYIELLIENLQLRTKKERLTIEKKSLKTEIERLTKQLEHMKALRIEMHNAFKHDRPIGTMKEVGRESLEFNCDGTGGTIHIVKYVDDSGTSFIYTEGFAENGDIAPKLFWLGYAVFFLAEWLGQLGFVSVPDRFVKLCEENPKFLGFVDREFQRIRDTNRGDNT
jgi:hypothetical protein